MVLVISHKSALWFWRTFGGNLTALKRVRRPVPMDRMPELTPSLRGELGRYGFFPTDGRPIDLLFSRAAARPRTPEVRSHCSTATLPAGSLIQLTDHVCITSPELTFALIARKQDVRHLALVASELCGTYVRTPSGQPLGKRPQLTTTARLQAFLAELHPKGTDLATAAARLAFDNAASPMEAKLALLLSLPSRMGGFGLPRPELNREFALSREARRVYSASPCRLDLSWRGTNLDVEYDGSGDEHTADMHAKDVARLAALHTDGLDVLVLAKQQVYHPAVFAQMVQVIAGKLTGQPGRARRIRTRDFEAKQLALREAIELE